MLPAPEQVILPLSQHVKARPCAPGKYKGDLVKMGQVVRTDARLCGRAHPRLGIRRGGGGGERLHPMASG